MTRTWDKLEYGWQAAFSKAWDALLSGSIPIGAACLNQKGEIVSAGQNMIYVEDAPPPAICGTDLAHAEMNAVVALKRRAHPDIRSYTLYTTTEPCLLCFGAVVMGNIRHLKYAARDSYAGAVGHGEQNQYVRSKNIKIEGPFRDLEEIQVAMATYYELEKKFPKHEFLISRMAAGCPRGVAAGKALFEKGALVRLAGKKGTAPDAFRLIRAALKETGGPKPGD